MQNIFVTQIFLSWDNNNVLSRASWWRMTVSGEVFSCQQNMTLPTFTSSGKKLIHISCYLVSFYCLLNYQCSLLKLQHLCFLRIFHPNLLQLFVAKAEINSRHLLAHDLLFYCELSFKCNKETIKVLKVFCLVLY